MSIDIADCSHVTTNVVALICRERPKAIEEWYHQRLAQLSWRPMACMSCTVMEDETGMPYR